MDGQHSGGGSRAVLSLVDQCGSSLYADLLRVFGVDMEGLFHTPPSLSPSKVLFLAENLPGDSLTAALSRGDEESAGWGTTEYLLAAVVDAVREGTFSNMQVRTKKKLKEPDPFPVPGLRKKEKPNQFVLMAQRAMANAG